MKTKYGYYLLTVCSLRRFFGLIFCDITLVMVFTGSLVATPHSSARKAHKDKMMFSSRHTNELEEWIDDYTKELPPLENFILPGGSGTYILHLVMYGKFLQSIHVDIFSVPYL